MSRVSYHANAERPALKLWLLDDDGTLINFSSGFTFAFKIGTPGVAALFTKSTGIVGAAGAGAEPDGTPNVTITWSAGDLDPALWTPVSGPGTYRWQLVCTTSALDRVFHGDITIEPIIT